MMMLKQSSSTNVELDIRSRILSTVFLQDDILAPKQPISQKPFSHYNTKPHKSIPHSKSYTYILEKVVLHYDLYVFVLFDI